jgi:hypothetical protein
VVEVGPVGRALQPDGSRRFFLHSPREAPGGGALVDAVRQAAAAGDQVLAAGLRAWP